MVAIAAVAMNTGAVAGADGILHTHYDAVTNDLLTAGLGQTGLGSATPLGFVDPLHPTAEELRRLAIYTNYRALVDPTPGGGFGTLYGPNVTADGTVTTSEGLIAGDEYIAFEKADDGRTRVTVMVQVPDGFNPAASCIVAAPSSARAAKRWISCTTACGTDGRCRRAKSSTLTPRGPGAPPITLGNVPPIADSPPPSTQITFTGGR